MSGASRSTNTGRTSAFPRTSSARRGSIRHSWRAPATSGERRIFTLGVVCARGGSKGLPGKNLRPLHGHPLIAYTIAVARACDVLDRVVVSTDDEEIASVSRRYGGDVPFLRPAELARDDTPKRPVVQHALRETERWLGRRVDAVVDLQPTSPLRSVEDVRACWERLQEPETDVAFTVAPSRENPYWDLVELRARYAVQSKPAPPGLGRRQDAPPVYVITGGAYAFRRDPLLADGRVIGPRSRIVIVPAERAHDVDTAEDLALVEWLVERGLARLPLVPAPAAAS